MDPTLLGLLAFTGAQNPETFSSAMAMTGMPPPTGGPADYYPRLAESIAPQTATPTPWQTTVIPTDASPSSAAGQTPQLAKALSPFAGVAKPNIPQPEMKAGVAGAQTAPKATAPGPSHEGQLLQMLLQGAAPRTPLTLGALLGR